MTAVAATTTTTTPTPAPAQVPASGSPAGQPTTSARVAEILKAPFLRGMASQLHVLVDADLRHVTPRYDSLCGMDCVTRAYPELISVLLAMPNERLGPSARQLLSITHDLKVRNDAHLAESQASLRRVAEGFLKEQAKRVQQTQSLLASPVTPPAPLPAPAAVLSVGGSDSSSRSSSSATAPATTVDGTRVT